VPAKLISIREVCDQYGLSDKTVRRKIKTGELDAYRCGPRLIKLDPDQVDATLLTPVTATGSAVEAAIERIVAAATPLSDEQRNRIAALLRTGSGGAA
jgi:excisionase family DNA binding protein